MPINLTISADSVQEFDTLLARFARAPIMPEIAHTTAAQEAATAVEPAKEAVRKSPRRSAKVEADEMVPQDEAVAATPAQEEVVAATPAATSGEAAPAASDETPVTLAQLKDAMSDLLTAKSASLAMQTLEAATGCKSLSSGASNVMQKAETDPGIMRKALDALIAAKTA